MDENTQSSTMNKKSSPPPVPQQDDDAHALLAAAIGLTSLGTPATLEKDAVKMPSASAMAGIHRLPGSVPSGNKAKAKVKIEVSPVPQSKKGKAPSTSSIRHRLLDGYGPPARPSVQPYAYGRGQHPLPHMEGDAASASTHRSDDKAESPHEDSDSDSMPKRQKIKHNQEEPSVSPKRQFHQAQNQGSPPSPRATVQPLDSEDGSDGDGPTMPPHLSAGPNQNHMNITLNFPEILYEIISDPNNINIISWLPHGRGFTIHDKLQFGSNVLPRHFEGAKFTSFTRRLKRWNFVRVSKGPEMGAYYNTYFIRDRADLVPSMMYGNEAGESGDGSSEEKQDTNLTEGETSIKEFKKERQEELKTQEGIVKSAVDEDHNEESETKSEIKNETATATEKSEVASTSKNSKKKKKKKKEKTESELRDDAVVQAAMEVHRKKQRDLNKKQEKEAERKRLEREADIKFESQYKSFQARKKPPQRKGSSSSKEERKKSKPSISHTAKDDNTAPLSPRSASWATQREVDERIREEIRTSLRKQHQSQRHQIMHNERGPNGFNLHQPEFDRRQRQGEGGMKRSHDQMDRSKFSSSRQGDGGMKGSPDQMDRSEFSSSRMGMMGPRDRMGHMDDRPMLPTSSGIYPEDRYMAMAHARANMKEMQAIELEMEMLRSRRVDFHLGLPGGNGGPSSRMTDMEMMRRRHQLNIISPPDSSEQQEHLNDIERQLLSEMSYPMLPTSNRNSSLYMGGGGGRGRPMGGGRSRSNNGGMDSMRHNMMSRDASPPYHSSNNMGNHLQRNNNRPAANRDNMISKIMASSKTHEESMMMAARDLEAKEAVGAGEGPGGHGGEMMDRQRIQQRMQHHSDFDSSYEYSRAQRMQLYSDEELMMMARTNSGRVERRQHSPSLPSSRMQQDYPMIHSSRMRMMNQGGPPPSSSARTRYHDMMLREIEEKVERETALAEASMAKKPGSRLRDSTIDEDFGYSAAARRISRH